MPARHGDELLHPLARAALISLHRQPQAAPLGVRAGQTQQQGLENLHRQLEAVDLFGINREIDVGTRSALAQTPKSGQ